MEQNNPGFVRFQPGEQISVWRAACALSGQSWAEATPAAATIEKAQLLCQKIVEHRWAVLKGAGTLVGIPLDTSMSGWTLLRLIAYHAEGIEDWNRTRGHLTGYLIAASALAKLLETLPTPQSGVQPSRLKKSALIDKYREQWPTAEQDINEKSRNGLLPASLGEGHYDEEKAVRWAKEKGKFKEKNLPPTSMRDSPVSAKKTW